MLNERKTDYLGDENLLAKKARYATISSKGDQKLNLDDMYDSIADNMGENNKSFSKKRRKDGKTDLERKNEIDMKSMRDKALHETKKRENDRFNFHSKFWPKHCVARVEKTNNFAILVCPWQPLKPVQGQFLIVPIIENCSNFLMLIRENLVAELNFLKEKLRKAVKSAYNYDLLFVETNFNNGMNMYVEAIPIKPRDTNCILGYFKQEISTAAGILNSFDRSNKSVIKYDSVSHPLHKIFPKAMLPYFYVEIYQPDEKLTKGYFHVIEDNSLFGKNFAYQVICGVENVDFFEMRNLNKNRDNDELESCLKRRKELRLILDEIDEQEENFDLAVPEGFVAQATGLDQIPAKKESKKKKKTEKVYGIQLPPQMEEKVYGIQLPPGFQQP